MYARVSSIDQKADLERQIGRLVTFADTNELTVEAQVERHVTQPLLY
ncbi:MAG: hypothetical protein DDT34_02431 [Firmicutes bacterium]|nr:hypothetical protein [Bacillota bacterium]